MTSLLATVIVVNWNGAHLLPACLDGLRRQNGAVPFQTWVVDNASHDESVELMRSRYPEVRIIQSDRNRGFAGGNNLALEMVTTPFAVLLNNDAVPEPDWLECLLAPMREPGSENLGATTGKVLFAARYARIRLSTTGFVPGPEDRRELGVRIGGVEASVPGDEIRPVLNEVLWERLTYGREGPPDGHFFWTRPEGEFLVPVPEGPVDVTFGWAAERHKDVQLSWPGGSANLAVEEAPSQCTIRLAAATPRVDVINNVGGIVIAEGYGADRGYQQVDDGQFDAPEEVFTACGNGVALRTELGHRLGWFDDDFFLYYEDTDLSWRLRALGYEIRYEPRAVLRHLHAASSQEWSPLFVFHVDRNRLLMLTKNATAALALRAVAHYLLTTASMFARSVLQAARARRRPPIRPTLLRLRVISSYARLLPRMLSRRRGPADAKVGRRALQKRWLLTDIPSAAPEPLPDTAEEAA